MLHNVHCSLLGTTVTGGNQGVCRWSVVTFSPCSTAETWVVDVGILLLHTTELPFCCNLAEVYSAASSWLISECSCISHTRCHCTIVLNFDKCKVWNIIELFSWNNTENLKIYRDNYKSHSGVTVCLRCGGIFDCILLHISCCV